LGRGERADGEAVADPFNHPQRGGGRVERAGEQGGSSEVGTSWPRSERRLAIPIPPTPGVSHRG
jgi:hypothetical protein